MTLEIYQSYLNSLRDLPLAGSMMPYGWARFPDQVSPAWLVYSQMLDEFARELANSVNALTVNIRKLSAWAITIGRLDDDRRLQATREFVDDLATNTLLLPYVIKSRFAFSVAHLSHQANKAWQIDWKDDLPLDEAIYLNVADSRASHWRSYRKLKLSLEAINGRAFKVATRDFRNAYNHRFSPRFVFGITQLVTRTVNNSGQVTYGIGGRPPLDIHDIAELLDRERIRCSSAFQRFQALITEQVQAISAFEDR